MMVAPAHTGVCVPVRLGQVYSSEDIPTDRKKLNVNVSARSLFETYLPAMKACVARAKATHVMCSCESRPAQTPLQE